MRVNGNCNVFYVHLHLAEWYIMYRTNILEDFENASPSFSLFLQAVYAITCFNVKPRIGMNQSLS